MNLYISDLHFGHKNVIAFDGRPFFDIKDMEDSIVKRWNATVSTGDMVYILGDFHWGKADDWRNTLNRLNGSKTLVVGNHDLKRMPDALRIKFSDVKDYKEIHDGGRRVVMSHYPMLFHKGCNAENTWMLHGHIHDTIENYFVHQFKRYVVENDNRGDYACRAQLVNVGCCLPYMDYTPRSLDYLIEVYKNGMD